MSKGRCFRNRRFRATSFPIRSIRGFSPIFPARSRNIPTGFACSKSAFRSTSGRGRSAGWPGLMLDFYDHPDFVRELLAAIADYNIAQVREALKYDIDAVYFGDDWGQQCGLQMGRDLAGIYLSAIAADVRRGPRRQENTL